MSGGEPHGADDPDRDCCMGSPPAAKEDHRDGHRGQGELDHARDHDCVRHDVHAPPQVVGRMKSEGNGENDCGATEEMIPVDAVVAGPYGHLITPIEVGAIYYQM